MRPKRTSWFWLMPLVILAGGLTLYVSSSATPAADGPGAEPQVDQPHSDPEPAPALTDYFPAEPGSFWEFEGTGSEFASFVRVIWFADGGRVQMAEATDGTQMIFVLRVDEETVTQVYSEEDFYDPVNLLEQGVGTGEEPEHDMIIILQAPLAAGSSWTLGPREHEIVETGLTVAVPAGTFEDVIKISVRHADSANLTYQYYAPGVGLIKREFIDEDGETVLVTSELEFYRLTGSTP